MINEPGEQIIRALSVAQPPELPPNDQLGTIRADRPCGIGAD
jgi:hypothetical protein